ncbi:MAG: hypothetical protein AB7K24_33030 [Gemmataceae bacterium]
MKTRSRLIALMFLSGLAILGTGLQARAPAGALPDKKYTKKGKFQLPVRIDQAERARLREVYLFVKNGPQEPWKLEQSVPPNHGHFIYQAPGDGEYWFSVVTVDHSGRQHPADVNAEPPGLIVVVDSQRPECEVKPMTSVNGDYLLHCEIRDANPDHVRTKVEFLAPDKTWRAVEPIPNQPGFFKAYDPAVLRSVVRATAVDKAGNTTARVFQLDAVMPVNAAMASQGGYPDTQEGGVMQSVSRSPSTGAKAGNTPPLLVVCDKRVALNYQVENVVPGSGTVDVWVTRDEGQSWQMVQQDPNLQSPVAFELPGEGLYGVTLSLNTLAKPSVPPTAGALPDCWVEIDATKPVAHLLAVRPGPTPETRNSYLITWTAADKNLKPAPIDLYYATSPQGPWQPIAKGLKNVGNHRWNAPAGLNMPVLVRMEVSDLAGNVTRCDSNQGSTASGTPRVRVLGLATPAGN